MNRRPGLVVWASGLLLALFYLTAVFAPFVAPYDFAEQNRNFPNCPPSRLHVNSPSGWGESIVYTHPFIRADPQTRRYDEQIDVRIPIDLFSRGHLFTTAPDGGKVFLLGTDSLGRDLFSRIVYRSPISFTIGTLVGSIAGYTGGWVDNIIMRLVEVEMSLPSFYFLLALASVIPPNLSSAATFFLIVVLLSFISWAGFARIIQIGRAS